MVKGYVLIQTSVGRSLSVIKTLRALPEVKSVDLVSGPYEVIAVVEGEDENDIGRVVLESFQLTPGVFRTITCVAC